MERLSLLKEKGEGLIIGDEVEEGEGQVDPLIILSSKEVADR